ncbi:MAG: hypothetical protein JO079_03300 [Frankiaceae bacterium]|nr:hypothetical protein [Frankiaceae bacterium]MBV9369290.1 hypothetical protein [Frankiales bacterium]
MGLTPAEDADLRRLASFDRLGFLDIRGMHRLAALRDRDRRTHIRPVEDVVDHLTMVTRPGASSRGARCAIYPV